MISISSLLSLAHSYHKDGAYTVASHSKMHAPRMSHIRERIQARNFNPEIKEKTQYDNNEDMRQNPVRRPQGGPLGSDNYSQYASEDNGGNYQKLPQERRRGPPSELRDDSPDSIKYVPNKGNDNYDRSYQDNYSERQSKSAYNDDMPRAKYNEELVNHETHDKQLSQHVFAERAREGDEKRNIRYETREINGPVRGQSQYHESEEMLNNRHLPYSDRSTEYQTRTTKDDKRYLQSDNKNYKTVSQTPNAVSDLAENKQYREHNRNQYDAREGREISTPKDSPQYSHQPQDNVPHHSSYRDPRISEQPYAAGNVEILPVHNRDNVPNHFSYGETDLREQETLKDKQPHQKQHRDPASRQQYEQHNQDHRLPRQRLNTYRQTPTGEHVEMETQEMHPTHQQPRNTMKVVETKRDMQPAPSEADSQISEEHDGFLDMGAYTDKQGSFGWYADFPVGKEHDKVTYSFSK